ncbi:unnamed protein product, partial [Sphacelaria rigidula]
AIQLAATVGLRERGPTTAGSSSASASEAVGKANVVVRGSAGKLADAGTGTRASFSGLDDWIHQTLAPILSLSAPAGPADHGKDVEAKRRHDGGYRGNATNEALPATPQAPTATAVA